MDQPPDDRAASGAAPPEIVTVGHPILRQRALPVDDYSRLGPLCDRLVATLRTLGGAGLAAPQLGISVRVLVVEVRPTPLFPTRAASPLHVLINPVIEQCNGEAEEDWEGCFSVPGLLGRVPRPPYIVVRYRAMGGVERCDSFSGYLARVIQHECDHLDGILFLDRMASLASLTTVENYRRRQRPPPATPSAVREDLAG